MSDYFEIDFLDVESKDSGDAIPLRYTKVWTIFQNSSCLVKRQGHILLRIGVNILRVCILRGTRRI